MSANNNATPTSPSSPNYGKPRQVLSADNLSVALAYIAKHPARKLFPAKGKGRPCIKDNLAKASNDPKQLTAWAKQFPGCVFCCVPRESGIICVDADMGAGKIGEASLARLVAAVGDDDEFRSMLDTETARTPSGGLHLIFEGVHKFSAPLKDFKDVDVPNYFVVPGQARDDGKRYTIIKDVPAMPAPAALQLIVKPPRVERTRTYSDDAVPLDVFKKMLAATPYMGGPDGLDNRHDYLPWLNFLMAVHEAAGGDQGEYKWAAIEWSLNDPNPDWKQKPTWEYVERKWESFDENASSAITRGSWFKVLDAVGAGDLVGEAGTAEDSETMRGDDAANDNDIAQMVEIAEAVAPDEQPEGPFPEPVGIKHLRSTKWPMPEFIVEDLVMKGTPNTFNADGGTGKTTVATQFGVCRAAGLPIFGKSTMQGPVLLVLSEDGEGITQSRVDAQIAELAIQYKFDPDELPLATWCLPGQDVALAKIDPMGRIKRLPFYDRLDAQIAKMGRGVFVVLDSLVDVVQMEMKDPAEANAFFKRLLMGLCIKHDATILVLAHPSKASMQDGTWSHGSLAFKNAVRHGIAMKIIEGQTYRELWSLKHNYTDENRMRLYFEYPIFTVTPPSASNNPEVVRDAAILALIVRTIREGKVDVVRTNQAAGYTPRDIAEALNTGGMVGQVHWKHVRSVMLKAEMETVIKYVPAFGQTKAHYEWLGDPTTPLDDPADDFGEG